MDRSRSNSAEGRWGGGGHNIFYMLACPETVLLLDFSLSVKAATLIFLSGCDSAISSAKEVKSGFIYNLVKS